MDVLRRHVPRELAFLALFVVLNVLDGRLTSAAISLGSSEANPFAAGFGSSMFAKAMIALGIAIILFIVGRSRLLVPLCAGMCLIVVWNTVAVWTWMSMGAAILG